MPITPTGPLESSATRRHTDRIHPSIGLLVDSFEHSKDAVAHDWKYPNSQLSCPCVPNIKGM
jgi:hypothetical protein